MKKTTLAMSALALSLGLALSPLATAAETASSAATAQQMPSLAPMLEKVMPSVVSINVEGSTTVNTRVCRVISSSSSATIRHSARTVRHSRAPRSVRAAVQGMTAWAAASSRNSWHSARA